MGKGPIANVFEAAFFLQKCTSLLFHLGHCSLKSAALSTQTFIIFHLRLCYGSVELLATVVALPVDLLLFLRHPFDSDVIISESCQDPHHQIQIRPIHDTFCSWFWLPIVCNASAFFLRIWTLNAFPMIQNQLLASHCFQVFSRHNLRHIVGQKSIPALLSELLGILEDSSKLACA